MIVSPDALRRDIVYLLKDIERQITEVKLVALEKDLNSEELRDEHGGWPMIGLLQAKASAYSALVALQIPKK